ARSEIPGGSRSTEARAVAERAAQDATTAAMVHGVTIQVDAPDSNVRVAAEFDLIQRALAPLIENALRFARRRVEVSIRIDANQVVFEVHDDGPGVEPTIREQIFEPGVSAGGNGAGSGAEAGSGAGLGLPLARRLAHASGGDIEEVATREG